MTETEMVDARVPPEELLYYPVITVPDGVTASVRLLVYRICATVAPVDCKDLLMSTYIVVIPWETWTWADGRCLRVEEAVREAPILLSTEALAGYHDNLAEALLALLSKATSNGLDVRRLHVKARPKREDDGYSPTSATE